MAGDVQKIGLSQMPHLGKLYQNIKLKLKNDDLLDISETDEQKYLGFVLSSFKWTNPQKETGLQNVF